MSSSSEAEVQTEPLVTIIIDSYNYGQYIEGALDSVLLQDFPIDRFEVLVIDDGSTDDTGDRVRKYGARVQYVYKPNGGQASAFNLGFARAKGEIIALLDADDYWLPGKLERIVTEFEKNPSAGMVYHRLLELNTSTGTCVDGSFAAISGNISDDRRKLLSYILYPTSALAFRRSSVAPLLPIPEALTIQADAHLAGLVIFLAPIIAINDSLAVYRIHGTNLFHASSGVADLQRTRRRVETRKALVEEMKAWLVAHGRSLSEPDLIDLFMQWKLRQEEDEFHITRPSRGRLFRHLWQHNKYFRPRNNPRHLALNYAKALAALILGHDNLSKFDDWHRYSRRLLGRGV
jgi:glycosyltransferase involved in cell wall biosynthesis